MASTEDWVGGGEDVTGGGTACSKSMVEAAEDTAGAVAEGLGVRGGQCSEGNGRYRRGVRKEDVAPKKKAQSGLGGDRRHRAGIQ